MNPWQKAVTDFHEKFGVMIGESPAIRDPALRSALIAEEASEACKAIDEGDLLEAIDGLVDTIYVCLGAAITFGVDLVPFFDEVHRTNMLKVGGATREDGKILKPTDWHPPNIRAVLHEQIGQRLADIEGERKVLLGAREAVDSYEEEK